MHPTMGPTEQPTTQPTKAPTTRGAWDYFPEPRLRID
eukprot:gene10838-biopygen1685